MTPSGCFSRFKALFSLDNFHVFFKASEVPQGKIAKYTSQFIIWALYHMEIQIESKWITDFLQMLLELVLNGNKLLLIIMVKIMDINKLEGTKTYAFSTSTNRKDKYFRIVHVFRSCRVVHTCIFRHLMGIFQLNNLAITLDLCVFSLHFYILGPNAELSFSSSQFQFKAIEENSCQISNRKKMILLLELL